MSTIVLAVEDPIYRGFLVLGERQTRTQPRVRHKAPKKIKLCECGRLFGRGGGFTSFENLTSPTNIQRVRSPRIDRPEDQEQDQ